MYIPCEKCNRQLIFCFGEQFTHPYLRHKPGELIECDENTIQQKLKDDIMILTMEKFFNEGKSLLIQRYCYCSEEFKYVSQKYYSYDLSVTFSGKFTREYNKFIFDNGYILELEVESNKSWSWESNNIFKLSYGDYHYIDLKKDCGLKIKRNCRYCGIKQVRERFFNIAMSLSLIKLDYDPSSKYERDILYSTVKNYIYILEMGKCYPIRVEYLDKSGNMHDTKWVDFIRHKKCLKCMRTMNMNKFWIIDPFCGYCDNTTYEMLNCSWIQDIIKKINIIYQEGNGKCNCGNKTKYSMKNCFYCFYEINRHNNDFCNALRLIEKYRDDNISWK